MRKTFQDAHKQRLEQTTVRVIPTSVGCFYNKTPPCSCILIADPINWYSKSCRGGVDAVNNSCRKSGAYFCQFTGSADGSALSLGGTTCGDTWRTSLRCLSGIRNRGLRLVRIPGFPCQFIKFHAFKALIFNK